MTRRYRARLLSLMLVGAVLLVAAAPADATLARLRALGDGGSYLEDDAGVLVWFAALVDYPDQVVLDLGHLDHDAGGSLNRSLGGMAGGLHARFDPRGRWGTLGVYVQETLPAGAPGGAVTLLGARSFGKLAFGGKAMFSSHFTGANANTDYGHGEALYFHAFGLAARCDLRDGLYGDLAGEVVNTQGDANQQDLWQLPAQNVWTTWGVRTRWFVGLNEAVALVPVFDHRQDDRAIFSPTVEAPADRHARRTACGLGLNLLRDPDNLVVVSAEYSWGRDRHDYLPGSATIREFDRAETTHREIHARAGLESLVRPWLVVRGSLQYLRLQTEERATRGETMPGTPDRWTERQGITVLTPVTLGVGILAGPFQADLVLNARWTETYGSFPFGPREIARGTYTGIVLGYRF